MQEKKRRQAFYCSNLQRARLYGKVHGDDDDDDDDDDDNDDDDVCVYVNMYMCLCGECFCKGIFVHVYMCI